MPSTLVGASVWEEDTLWHLLVRLMEMDTGKHLEILTFVRKHAAKSIA